MKTVWSIVLLLLMTYSFAIAQEAPPAKVVTTAIVIEEIVENQSFIGLLNYDRRSQVSAEVSGLVTEVLIKEGDQVKTGSPLVKINTDMLDQEIAINKAKIKQIDLRIKHHEKNYHRLDNLYAEKGISEKDFDDAAYTYQDALQEKQIVENSLNLLLTQKRKCIVYAPFDGVILNKNVDKGDWVQQGKLLVLFGSTNDLSVRVPVSETLLKFIEPGQNVPVQINSHTEEITGTIGSFDPIADPQTKNVFLKIHIPQQAKIAENMSATVFIPTSAPKSLSIIPRDALIKFQGKDFVYTIKEGKAAILPINIVSYMGTKVGADNPYFTEGMPVVIEGNERLRPDQPVVVAGE